MDSSSDDEDEQLQNVLGVHKSSSFGGTKFGSLDLQLSNMSLGGGEISGELMSFDNIEEQGLVQRSSLVGMGISLVEGRESMEGRNLAHTRMSSFVSRTPEGIAATTPTSPEFEPPSSEIEQPAFITDYFAKDSEELPPSSVEGILSSISRNASLEAGTTIPSPPLSRNSSLDAAGGGGTMYPASARVEFVFATTRVRIRSPSGEKFVEQDIPVERNQTPEEAINTFFSIASKKEVGKRSTTKASRARTILGRLSSLRGEKDEGKDPPVLSGIDENETVGGLSLSDSGLSTTTDTTAAPR